MSEWIKSEKDAERIIAAELAVAVAPIVFMAARWAFYALGNQIAQAAGYECAQNACTTEDAEHVVAAYTIWLVVFTGFLAFFTAALFIATYMLFRTAAEDGAKALDQSRELFAVERRPWIRLSYQIISDMRVLVGDSGEVTVRVTATNIGLSPAFRVRIHRPPNQVDGFDDMDYVALAAHMERHRANTMAFGVALFPGEPLTQEWEIVVPNARSVENAGPIVCAWVVYRFSEDEARAHVTPVFEELLWDGEPGVEGYRLDQMRLRRLPVQLTPD